MESRFLEVTFRKGKPVAAYLYLTADNGVKSQRSQKAERGLVLDYGETDQLKSAGLLPSGHRMHTMKFGQRVPIFHGIFGS